MAGSAQIEKSNMQDVAVEATKRMEPIVKAVSNSRTPSEIITKLEPLGCKSITTKPPGFLKEPETINFKKAEYSYQIDVGEKRRQ